MDYFGEIIGSESLGDGTLFGVIGLFAFSNCKSSGPGKMGVVIDGFVMGRSGFVGSIGPGKSGYFGSGWIFIGGMGLEGNKTKLGSGRSAAVMQLQDARNDDLCSLGLMGNLGALFPASGSKRATAVLDPLFTGRNPGD